MQSKILSCSGKQTHKKEQMLKMEFRNGLEDKFKLDIRDFSTYTSLKICMNVQVPMQKMCKHVQYKIQ